MQNIQKLIKARRSDLDLSQAELAQLSEVSLPTIQNVEAGKANLSHQTLLKLLTSLQIEMNFSLKTLNLKKLVAIGVPLVLESEQAAFQLRKIREKEVVKTLNHELLLISDYHTREGEAVLAYCWSLKSHFPSTFELLEPNLRKKLKSLFQSDFFLQNSKLIKLKRICVDTLSKVLIR
jgi:transcriptional regulator with XRE-family HTH domain